MSNYTIVRQSLLKAKFEKSFENKHIENIMSDVYDFWKKLITNHSFSNEEHMEFLHILGKWYIEWIREFEIESNLNEILPTPSSPEAFYISYKGKYGDVAEFIRYLLEKIDNLWDIKYK